MGNAIVIGAVLAVIVLAVIFLRRPKAGRQATPGDAHTSTDTRLPGPGEAEAQGPAQAPPGSRPDREAHGKP